MNNLNRRRKAKSVRSPFWMLNAGFGRAEKQTPLCYRCADVHKEIRRSGRGGGTWNQTATCALCIRKRGRKRIGKTRRTAREQTQPPARGTKTFSSIHFVSKGLPAFPLSFCLTRTNVVIKPPARPNSSFPLFGALVNRITL